MNTRRVSLVYLVLLFISAFIVPAPHITIPEIIIPEIKILPFTPITIPKVTIPSTTLPSLGNPPHVSAVVASITLSITHGKAGATITVIATPVLFPGADAGPCTWTSSPPGLFASSGCTIGAGGTVTGSFIVSSTAPGGGSTGVLYSVTVISTVTPADFATVSNAPPVFFVDPTITLSPTSGSPQVGSGSPPGGAPATTVTVTGTGFNPTDTGCSYAASAPAILVISSPTCTVTGATGQLTGSFTVGAGSVFGMSTVTATGNVALDPSAPSNTFSVVGNIVLNPTSGSAGSTIAVLGAGFSTTVSATCAGPPSITGTPVGGSGTCTKNADGTFTGQFTVQAVLSGTYIVTYTDIGGGGTAFKTFTVTGGPVIALSLFIGPVGTVVTVTGSGFNAADTSVSISNSVGPPNLFTPSPFTCSVSLGNIAAGCTFTVAATGGGAVPPGFTVTATGTTADSSPANFLVIATLTLTPNNGGPNIPAGAGTTVSLSGNGYLPAGPACAGITTESPPLSSGLGCSISGVGVLTGTFQVSNAAVAGLHTFGISSAARVPQTTVSASFTVTVPMLTFSPNSGSGDDTIHFNASGFSTGDATCSLTQPTLGLGNTIAAVPPPSCNVSGGVVTGSFVVVRAGNGAEVKTLLLTGSTGDGLTAPFSVVPQISHTLSPNPARLGATVSITGSNFATAFGTCTISSAAVPPSVTGGSVVVGGCIDGAFLLTAAALFVLNPLFVGLSDTIKVTDTAAPAFSASATLNVIPRVVTLTPNFGPRSAVIAVGGSGFAIGDAGPPCTPAGSSAMLITAFTCSIAPDGTVTGSFTVDPTATNGPKTVKINGATGDFGSAPFTVTAAIALVPTVGRAGINVLVTGSGFAAADTGCTLSSTPPGLVSAGPTCAIAGGLMSGSFIVAGVASGTYTVTVTGNTGDFGSATFTIPPAPTLGLSPTSGLAGTGVFATGANWVGTTCLLSSNPSNLLGSPSCTISGGALTGSFTVASGANIGTSYAVTAQSNAAETASATFTVSQGPLGTLTLNPSSGPVGTAVTGSATGFTTDVSCTLSASPAGLFASTNCTIAAGTAIIGFVVSAGAAASSYTVLAVGDKGHAASGTFTLTGAPAGFSISVNPSALAFYQGQSGQSAVVSIGVQSQGSFSAPVTLTVTGFPTGVAGAFNNNPVTPPPGGSTNLQLSITVSNTAPATTTPATLQIQGTSGSLIATGSLALSVSAATTTSTTTAAVMTLSPASGPPGTSVTVFASNIPGTSCVISASPAGLFLSQACSISSGTATGTFTVSLGAPVGGYVVTVATNVGGSASALFSVTAPVTTPTVTVTGTTPGGLPFPTPPVPIPGFPWESIIAGLAIAMLALGMLRRRRQSKQG